MGGAVLAAGSLAPTSTANSKPSAASAARLFGLNRFITATPWLQRRTGSGHLAGADLRRLRWSWGDSRTGADSEDPLLCILILLIFWEKNNFFLDSTRIHSRFHVFVDLFLPSFSKKMATKSKKYPHPTPFEPPSPSGVDTVLVRT